MCYNYDIMEKKLEREFPDLTGTLHDPAEWDNNPFHSAFTFRKGPVIIRGEGNELHYFNWGLIPMWTKSLEDAKKIRTQTLNARSETVFEKPSFRASISKKRCLIPASGFYDWRDYNSKKYPYYIYLKDRELFSFAGIYESWTDRETGELINTYSMLTVDANPMMAKIHNTKERMPVILAPELLGTFSKPMKNDG
jgi:putative SOS response-associated peptidase YedK